MEFFVHLRKGKTPRRLKDDGQGRGGVIGRTANMSRRHVAVPGDTHDYADFASAE